MTEDKFYCWLYSLLFVIAGLTSFALSIHMSVVVYDITNSIMDTIITYLVTSKVLGGSLEWMGCAANEWIKEVEN